RVEIVRNGNAAVASWLLSMLMAGAPTPASALPNAGHHWFSFECFGSQCRCKRVAPYNPSSTTHLLPAANPTVDVCGSYSTNPCAVGTCINDGKGAYSCICPPNYVGSITADNLPTCDLANTTASMLTVNGANWRCSDVSPVVSVSLAGFTSQNMAVKCDQPLPQGKVIALGSAPATPCTAFFYALKGDTCSSISVQLGLASTYLASLNPGLDCSEPIKAGRSLYIERNATFAFTIPRCLQYSMLSPQDTCESLLLQSMDSSGDGSTGVQMMTASWIGLYRNNPGIICPRTTPASSASVASTQVRVGM
ncbi:unnamed protein product, partial [Closterium sp. Yama58-4]